MQGNSGHFWLLLLFSQSVMSDSLQPHGLQHTRPLCPSPSPKVCPSWCPLHQWCHPPISSSDTLLSFCLQSFPASGTFPMSQLFTSDDEILEFQLQHQSYQWVFKGWFPLRLTGSILDSENSILWIRLQCRRPQFNSWVGKIHWRRDRLPTPVFLEFPCGSSSKESACNTGDLGSIPGGKNPWRRERLPTPVFWPGEFHWLYMSVGLQRVRPDWVTFTFTVTENNASIYIVGIFFLHICTDSDYLSIFVNEL